MNQSITDQAIQSFEEGQRRLIQAGKESAESLRDQAIDAGGELLGVAGLPAILKTGSKILDVVKNLKVEMSKPRAGNDEEEGNELDDMSGRQAPEQDAMEELQELHDPAEQIGNSIENPIFEPDAADDDATGDDAAGDDDAPAGDDDVPGGDDAVVEDAVGDGVEDISSANAAVGDAVNAAGGAVGDAIGGAVGDAVDAAAAATSEIPGLDVVTGLAAAGMAIYDLIKGLRQHPRPDLPSAQDFDVSNIDQLQQAVVPHV